MLSTQSATLTCSEERSGIAAAVPLPLEGIPIFALNFLEHSVTSLFETTESHGLNVRVVDGLRASTFLNSVKVQYLLRIFDRLWHDGPLALPPQGDLTAWKSVLQPLLPVLDPNDFLEGSLAVLPGTVALVLRGKIWTGAFKRVNPKNIPSTLYPPKDLPIPLSREYQVNTRQRLIASTSRFDPVTILKQLVARVEEAVRIEPLPALGTTPRALENQLRACPGVDDAAVIVVEDPGGAETVFLFLVPKEHESPDLEKLQDAHFGAGYHPKNVFMVEALPRGSDGRLMRGMLRASLVDVDACASSSSGSNGPIMEKVRAVVRKELGLA